jgi:lysozyme
VGKLTIGVGRNLDDVGISESEALMLLGNDITRAQAGLDRELPWWRGLSAGRQIALTDLAFNMGIQGLLTFRHTLAALAQGDWPEAAQGLKSSLWARQVHAARVADVVGLIEGG